MTPAKERYPVALNQTQRNQILLCLFPGNCTGPEISAITGLTVKTVAAYLYAMEKAKEVVVVGKVEGQVEYSKAKPSALYQLTKLGRRRVPGPADKPQL